MSSIFYIQSQKTRPDVKSPAGVNPSKAGSMEVLEPDPPGNRSLWDAKFYKFIPERLRKQKALDFPKLLF
jgi:hypothetical protein